MLQTKKILILLLTLLITHVYVVNAAYIETNKDTKMPPDTAVIVPLNTDGYTELYRNDNFIFNYKQHNGVFAITDRRNGYTWKTGIDHDFDQFIERTVELFIEQNPDATPEEIEAVAKPIEDQMNNTREGIANSLITIEYFNRDNVSNPTTTIGSSAKTFIIAEDPNNPGTNSVQERKSDSMDTSKVNKINNDDTHYRVDFKFKRIDIEIKVHVYFSLDGIRFEIRDDELGGEDIDMLGAITLAPFMGAYGGKQFEYNKDTADWDIPTLKLRNPGYMLVPDGSGALIRFEDYASKLSGYTGYVYSDNLAQQRQHFNTVPNYVPFENPTMPLFGVAVGNQQAAFLAYATSGEEFMQVIARPNDSSDSYNLTNYNIIHSRFVYNKVYTQYYNEFGGNYPSLFENRNRFDVNMNYAFLSGDGSTTGYSADYVGMALKYRDVLHARGILSYKEDTTGDIPTRIDFVMSDAKNALVGTQDVVVTTIKQVEKILTQLKDDGVTNINSGLYGYQKGGITLGHKSKPNWSNSIGSKGEFDKVITNLAKAGIDVSLALNYSQVTEEQMSLTRNVSKHVNGWYIEETDRRKVGVAQEFYLARPSKIVSWIKSNEKATRSLGIESMTFEGFTNRLYADYSGQDTTVTKAIELYQNALDQISEKHLVNAVKPNQYLWAYTDRFLQTPMFSSQYLVQTDTVPFLQLVLNQSMELFSTYVNFSFYNQRDILRMIDYNTYPAFVLTHNPSYELASTNAADYYSTQYIYYMDMIKNVQAQMNGALSSVQNAKWINRTVLAPGVILNAYDNGIKIVINYTDTAYTHAGVTIDALAFGLVL